MGHEKQLRVDEGSPADVAAEQMRNLVESGQAATYNEAHQILMGKRKARDPMISPPIMLDAKEADPVPPLESD